MGKNRQEDRYRSQVLAQGDDYSNMPVVALWQLMRKRNLPLALLKASVSASFCLSVARFAEQQCFWRPRNIWGTFGTDGRLPHPGEGRLARPRGQHC